MPLPWPTEPPGYVNMAAAFEKFGAERYREEWTGTERVASPPLKVLPEIHLASNDDRDNAFSHLSWARPDVAAGMIVHPSWLESVFGGHTRRLPFSDEGWAIAMEASRGLFRSQEPHFVRGDAVRREMAALCYNGEMEAFARPVSGGGMTPIPTDAWNTECLFGRFHDCKISLRDPFGAAGQAADVSWIFVTQSSLDMVCARDPKAGRKRRPYYSPYIRCMHATAKKLGITRRKQPKKASVELDLEKQFDAAGLKDYGAHLVQAAATLLRDPESQLGRGKKSHK
jgi:hypothetical protein